MSKKVAELYRELADKIDEIEALRMQLETEKQIRDTADEQLKLANSQLETTKKQLTDTINLAESYRLTAVEWREKSLNQQDTYAIVKNLFNSYSMQDFIDLEAVSWESRGLVSSDDYESIEDYEAEAAYADNLINLAEDIKTIKGEFFNECEGEENDIEQLNEF